MANQTEAKTKKVKKEKVAKAPAHPISEKTGYRENTLGHAIALAYLGETKHEKAVEAVEEIIKASCKSRGKSTAADYVHGRAVSWIGFLKVRDAKKFQDLPKAEKPKAEEKKAEAKA